MMEDNMRGICVCVCVCVSVSLWYTAEIETAMFFCFFLIYFLLLFPLTQFFSHYTA